MALLDDPIRRDKAIRVRYSDAERKAIKARALDAEMTTSDFIRHSALGAPVHVVKLERLHPADLNQIKRLGNLLNQIARAMHRGRMVRGTLRHLGEVMTVIDTLVLHQLKQWGPP
jgi:uncharacterized protein (DUF1778 family)